MSKLFKNGVLKLPHSYIVILRSSLLARNISRVYGGDILSKCLALGTLLLLIRGLSINDYAAYTAFWTIMSLVPGLIGSGINMALVRFSAEYLSKTNKRPFGLYIIGCLFQLVLYILSCLILFSISDKISGLLFGQKDFGYALQYGLIAGLGLLLTQVGRSIYQAEERFGIYIKTLWLRQILAFVAISFLFLMKQLNFQHAAQSMIIVNLAVGSIVGFHIFKDLNLRRLVVSSGEQLDIIKSFLSSTRWLIVYFFTLTAFQRLDVFMLSHLSTERELANYGIAFRYYSLALLLLGSIHAVLLPQFSKIEMQDAAKQRQFALKWLKIVVWIIIPITIIDAFGKPLFIWVNGVQYEKAFYIFVVFSIGVWLSLMFSPLVNVLMSRKAFKFLFLLSLCALILNFTGNYLLIPLWGGVGAAVVTIFSHNFLIQGLILIKVLRDA